MGTISFFRIKFLFLLFIFLVFICFSTNRVFATDKVEINTASLAQLDEIIGIGPALAQRIIDARPFSSVDDLIKVSGIGEKTLQKIKDQGLAYVEGAGATEVAIIEETTSTEPITATNEQTKEAPPDEKSAKVEPPLIYPTGVVINEILPSPEGDDSLNEWIELYNTNDFNADISDWQIKDALGSVNVYTIPKDTQISAYGFLVFKRPETKITLNNDEDQIFLITPAGTVADKVLYEKASAGLSYNRFPSGWAWSKTITPGLKNIIQTNESANLPKQEKFDISNEVSMGLAGLNNSSSSQNLQNGGAGIKNPWLLFFTALIITITSSIAVIILKFKLKGVRQG